MPFIEIMLDQISCTWLALIGPQADEREKGRGTGVASFKNRLTRLYCTHVQCPTAETALTRQGPPPVRLLTDNSDGEVGQRVVPRH